MLLVALAALGVALNFGRLASMGYHNLALLALSAAVVNQEPQPLAVAEQYAAQAVAYNGRATGELAYRLGIAKQQLGLEAEALVDYQRALQTQKLPTSVTADLLLRLGKAQLASDNVAAATASFEQLLAMDVNQLPFETVAYANVYMGELIIQQSGDLFLARAYLERAVALLVDARTMGRYLALISQMRKHGGQEYLDVALEMATFAVKKQATSTWTVLSLCNVHLDRQENAEAITWCQRARDLDPKNHHAYVWLGIGYRRLAMWQEALDAFEKAASLTSDNGWYLSLAAQVRAELAEQ